MNRKKTLIFLLIAIAIVSCLYLFNNNFKKFDINKRIVNYDLINNKDGYIDYLKESIYPIKLRAFIDNDYISFSQYNDTATGHSIKNQMIKDKEIIVEVYGNFKNTEPTSWTKHHFHYALDEEGNVDDVVFDYTDK